MTATRAPDCHPERAYRARGMCDRCYYAWLKTNNPEYVERQREKARTWRRRNGNPKRIRTKEHNRKKTLKKYGLTPERYDEWLRQQGGVCALCFRLPVSGRRLHVDHCHDTGRVRGILCYQCNAYLGVVEKDEAILKRLSTYIEKPFPSALVVFRRAA